MHIVICSLVKNGMSYLPAYRKQLEGLSLSPDTAWNLCVLEGDSDDDSWGFLSRWASEDSRIIVGREDVGEASERIDDRAVRWARAGNACLDLVSSIDDYTHILWLESDLAFPLDLLSRLLSCKVDIVAPMIWIGGHFYDTWGFRDMSGRKWSNEPPYHPKYRAMALIEMGSVGSCVLMRREVLDSGIRFRGPYETGLLVGICNDARSKGFRVFVDTSTSILHPVTLWEEQMWKVASVEITDRDSKTISCPTEEMASLGAALQIPFLSEESIVLYHQNMLKEICRKWRTNHVGLMVEMESPPSRIYRMVFSVMRPTGLGRLSCLLPFLLLILQFIPLKVSSSGGRVSPGWGPIGWFCGFSVEIRIVNPDVS